MAIGLTIGGVSKAYRAGTLEIAETINGRTTASFAVRSNDGSYRPALRAEVLITNGATRIFGGLIDRPTEQGVFKDLANTASHSTNVNAVDFNAYAEWRVVNETFPAQTLKARLTTIVTNYLSVYGVTLDGSQVDGPDLPEQKYDLISVENVLNETMTLTGSAGEAYAWNIDFFKVLSATQPSTVAAPFNITASNDTIYHDVTVETSAQDYANRVYIKIPTKKVENRVESFVGDGSTSEFTLQYGLTKHNAVVSVNGQPETLATAGTGFDLAVSWLYHPDTNTIERVQSGVADPPSADSGISITFDGTFGSERTFSVTETIPEGNDTWDLQYPIETHTGYVIVNGVFYEPLETGIAGPTWTISEDRQTITRLTGPLPTGYSGSITYTAKVLSPSTSAEDAAEIASVGPVEKVIVVEDVPSGTTADALAAGYLAKFLNTPKRVTYTTFTAGLHPGQTQSIVLPLRNLNDTFLISDVVTVDYGVGGGARQLVYSVKAVSGETDQDNWRDTYKLWSGDKTGKGQLSSPVEAGAGAPASVGPAPPLRSVQFNDGAFGGDTAFLYYKEVDSVTVGTDHSLEDAVTGSTNVLIGSGHTVS